MRTLICTFCISILASCATMQAQGVGTKFTSFAGFELGTVTLADIQTALGPAKLVETGDAGEYTASVCYTVPEGFIIFLAGELDGPGHDLGGFGFSKSTDRGPCSRWPTVLSPPNLSIGGLHLGISLAEFTRIVGVPIHVEGQKAYAHFKGKRTINTSEIRDLPEQVQNMIKTGEQQNYFDVMVSLVATFNNDRLQELRIWKTETL